MKKSLSIKIEEIMKQWNGDVLNRSLSKAAEIEETDTYLHNSSDNNMAVVIDNVMSTPDWQNKNPEYVCLFATRKFKEQLKDDDGKDEPKISYEGEMDIMEPMDTTPWRPSSQSELESSRGSLRVDGSWTVPNSVSSTVTATQQISNTISLDLFDIDNTPDEDPSFR